MSQKFMVMITASKEVLMKKVSFKKILTNTKLGRMPGPCCWSEYKKCHYHNWCDSGH